MPKDVTENIKKERNIKNAEKGLSYYEKPVLNIFIQVFFVNYASIFLRICLRIE